MRSLCTVCNPGPSQVQRDPASDPSLSITSTTSVRKQLPFVSLSGCYFPEAFSRLPSQAESRPATMYPHRLLSMLHYPNHYLRRHPN